MREKGRAFCERIAESPVLLLIISAKYRKIETDKKCMTDLRGHTNRTGSLHVRKNTAEE